MDQIGLDPGRIEIGAAPDCAKDGMQLWRATESGRIELESPDGKISRLLFLTTETPHLNRHRFRQLARKIIDVHSRPAVNERRIFVREKQRLHEGFLNAGAPKRTRI
jgi:hypothetical protein